MDWLLENKVILSFLGVPTVLWLVEECPFYLGDLCWSFRGEISSYLQLPFERFWKMWLYRVGKNRCDSLAVGKLGGRVDKCSWYYSFRVFVDLNFSVIKTGGRLIIYTFIVKRKMKQTTQETVKSESESRSLLSQLFATPCTIQSTEFSRPEYWSG